jgi:hypothetical protein
MRHLVFLTVTVSCGSPSPQLAPLLLELENDGPAGTCSLGPSEAKLDGGVVWPEKGLRDPLWLVGGPFDAGERRAADSLKAPVGTTFTFTALGPEYLEDGGCDSTQSVPPEGLRLRASYRSDSDGGPGRHHVSCDFTASSP